eukprot:13097_5
MHYDQRPKCGAGCSLSPDLRGTYSVNIFSAEVVKRIWQHANSQPAAAMVHLRGLS